MLVSNYLIINVATLNSWFSGFGPNLSISNPVKTFVDYLGGFLTFVTMLAVGFVIYAGVLYITSAGDDTRVKKAQSTMTYAILGLIVTFLSGIIIQVVLRMLGAI